MVIFYEIARCLCLCKNDALQLDSKTFNLSLHILNGTKGYWNSISQIK